MTLIRVGRSQLLAPEVQSNKKAESGMSALHGLDTNSGRSGRNSFRRSPIEAVEGPVSLRRQELTCCRRVPHTTHHAASGTVRPWPPSQPARHTRAGCRAAQEVGRGCGRRAGGGSTCSLPSPPTRQPAREGQPKPGDGRHQLRPKAGRTHAKEERDGRDTAGGDPRHLHTSHGGMHAAGSAPRLCGCGLAVERGAEASEPG
jgi:hypothetical protein